MLRLILGWIFFFTQVGLLFTMAAGVMVMIRMNQKLDRDYGDRELLRKWLMRESETARAGVEAVDPASLTDRRQHP